MNSTNWIYQSFLESLHDEIGHDGFSAWFNNPKLGTIKVRGIYGKTFVLEAPSKFFRDRIEVKYKDIILRVAQRFKKSVTMVSIISSDQDVKQFGNPMLATLYTNNGRIWMNA